MLLLPKIKSQVNKVRVSLHKWLIGGLYSKGRELDRDETLTIKTKRRLVFWSL